MSIVIAELKLRDVQRQILCADLMEASNDAAFEDRPEAFNGVRMNRADHVLPSLMVWAFQQWGTQQSWWIAMPWLIILLIILAFFAGAISDIQESDRPRPGR